MVKVKKKPADWIVTRLKEAVKEKDFRTCCNIAETIRIVYGMRYHEICDFVKEHTGLEVAEWDSFMEEGDSDAN